MRAVDVMHKNLRHRNSNTPSQVDLSIVNHEDAHATDGRVPAIRYAAATGGEMLRNRRILQ